MTTVWENNIEYSITYDSNRKPILVEKPVTDGDKYHLVINESALHLTSVTVYNIPDIADYIQEIKKNSLFLYPKKKIVETTLTEEKRYNFHQIMCRL